MIPAQTIYSSVPTRMETSQSRGFRRHRTDRRTSADRSYGFSVELLVSRYLNRHPVCRPAGAAVRRRRSGQHRPDLAGKVTVNLNYTLTEDVVNYCIREAGIKQVITSRAFMEKRPMKLEAEAGLSGRSEGADHGLDRAVCLCWASLMPRHCRRKDASAWIKIKADDPMTVIFTSGSTGEPKGVVLSQHNIGSNVDASTN